MACLWIDGFDTQDLRPYIGAGSTTWAGGRFGGYCYLVIVGQTTLIRGITPSAEVYCGSAHSLNTSLATVVIGGSGVTHLTLSADIASGVLTLYRGTTAGTVLATSAAGVVVGGAWNYIEVHAIVHDTTGVCQVRVGGVATNVIDFTGDTRNGGTTANIDAIGWQVSGNNAVDDVYIFDATGSRNNTWNGDCRVATMFPAGAGSSTDLVPSTAVANYTTVDEVQASASDYNGSATSGARDLYAMNDLSAASVAVVKTTVNAHKSDTGAKSFKPAMKIGSTVYYGPTMVLTTSMVPQFDFYETSPATSAAWTPTEVNGMECGAEVV